MTRRGAPALPALLVAIALARPLAGATPPAAGWREIPLGGRLVAALAAGDGRLLLLVRPADAADGPRRLLALADGTTTPVPLLDGLGGWTKALAAIDLGRGTELVAGGLGRLVSLGPLARPAGERMLIEHPGFDLRSLSPAPLRAGVEPEIAAAEVGALRIWRPDGAGGLTLETRLEIPFTVERNEAGLRLAGSPVVRLPATASGARRYAAGPDAVGARLRVVLFEAEQGSPWRRAETWSALPGPESVEESWLGAVDGAPALVARTQRSDEINAFEDQLWRVFLPAPDRTRAGRRPELAVAVDSKRWHDVDALLADGDGDGRTDLLIARPEGLLGGDLVVEVFAGAGGGRFEPRSRRSDLDHAPSQFALLADADGAGHPGLAALGDEDVTLRRFAASGRAALERTPLAVAPRPARPAKAKEKKKETEKDENAARVSWLGAVARAGGPPDLLYLATPEKGEERLVLVRTAKR